MATDRQCVEYARECVRLAGQSKDLQLRDQLLNMAREAPHFRAQLSFLRRLSAALAGLSLRVSPDAWGRSGLGANDGGIGGRFRH